MNYFKFNGIDSRTLGVYMESAPEIPSGAIRSETQSIIGSAKVLHYTEGPDAMDPISISIDCIIADSPSDATITAIVAWLRGGGDLWLSHDAGHIYKKAWVENQIPINRAFRLRSERRFTVEFECEAHRYIYPEAEAFSFATQGRLANPGTAPAEPLIRLNGSGDVSLLIDDTSLLIDGVSSYVMIDCETQMVYKGNANLGSSVTRIGDWPVIAPGGSLINWTGNVTGLVITPRWRDY